MPKKSDINQRPKRRTPRQKRAQEKVEFMFEAVLQILEKDGLEGLTTNRIAEVAGVSIGTLYQYFPNKEALLEAVSHHGIAQIFDTIKLQIQQANLNDSHTPRERALQVIRTIISVLSKRLHAKHALVKALSLSGKLHIMDDYLVELNKDLRGTAQSPDASQATENEQYRDIRAFVMSRAVAGALRAALIYDEQLLKEPMFEDALVDLVVGFSEQTSR